MCSNKTVCKKDRRLDVARVPDFADPQVDDLFMVPSVLKVHDSAIQVSPPVGLCRKSQRLESSRLGLKVQEIVTTTSTEEVIAVYQVLSQWP